MDSIPKNLLSKIVQEFILEHQYDDVSELILKYDQVDGVPMSVIADQINGRKKAKEKIPLYYNTAGIVFPPGINLEQCSSETTARFKTTIVQAFINDRRSCVDLTGGFGIDTMLLCNEFTEVTLVEPNTALLKISEHNHALLGLRNITYENMSAEDFLSHHATEQSLFYIDPSRRALHNRKVFSLKDCIPDITVLQAQIFDRSDYLLLKCSPLLDIKQGLTEVSFVSHVYVVSVNNECRELLFFCQKGFNEPVNITAIDISRDTASHSFVLGDEHEATVSFSDPLKYLYEPNAALLKAGAFKLIGRWFNVHKIAPNTHLYTSNELVREFPGRRFEVKAFVKPKTKLLKQHFPQGKANITLRNYPMTVHALKKATGLLDGGERYLLGFSGRDQKFLAVADKIVRDR